MTLREFIEQEIREDHVFDIEEFGTKLTTIEWEDREEIEPKEFEKYLDYNLDSVVIIHNRAYAYATYYETSIEYLVWVKACGFDKNSTDFEVGKIEVVRKI